MRGDSWVVIGAVVWLQVVVASQAPPLDGAQPTVVTAADLERERATFDVMCGICHPGELIEGMLRTPADFTQLIATMQSYGATGAPEEFATARTFMLRYWGKVNVNTDSAADLVPVLGISRGLAQAIVDRRVRQGPLSSLEDLKAIVGLDASRLEALEGRITF